MRAMKHGVMLLLAAVLLLSACSDWAKKPVRQTLEGEFNFIWDARTGLSPDLFVTNSLKDKFPDVTFQFTNIIRTYFHSWSSEPPLDIYHVVENKMPGDLVMIESILAPYLFKTGYLEPLDSYLTSDTAVYGRLSIEALDYVKAQGGGQIYGIPYGKNVYALYYNQDIFDDLQLPYPTDGMTWDEVFELAWKIEEHPSLGNRVSLRVPDENLAFSQFHIRVFNPETGMPDSDSPLWEKQLQFTNSLLDIENRNQLIINGNLFEQFALGNIAMIAGRFQGDSSNFASHETSRLLTPIGINWDMVSFPVHADYPGIGPAPAYYYLGIPKNSIRKDDAYELISYLLTDEVQRENSRHGLANVLNNEEMNHVFGELNPTIYNKRVQAYFYHPQQGTLDPEYDADMQWAGAWTYMAGGGTLNKIIDHRINQLGKVVPSTEYVE